MSAKLNNGDEHLLNEIYVSNIVDGNENIPIVSITDPESKIFADETSQSSLKENITFNHKKPSFLSDEIWTEYQSIFPWLYHSGGRFLCFYCEDALKRNQGMISSNWACGNTVKLNAESTRGYNVSKIRFERHSKTRNHILATEILNQPTEIDYWTSLQSKYPWLDGDPMNIRCSLCENAYKKSKNSMIITMWTPSDLNNQQSTVQFSTVQRLDRHEKCRNHLFALKLDNHDKNTLIPKNNYGASMSTKRKRKSAPVKSPDETEQILPFTLSPQQFLAWQACFPWLHCRNESSFLCKLCPDSNSLVKFKFDSSISFIKQKLLEHWESECHECFASRGGDRDARTTRLQLGIGPKIDYRRLSNGMSDVEWNRVTAQKPESRPWSCPQCKSHFVLNLSLVEHISLCEYQSTDTVRQLSCPCHSHSGLFHSVTKLDLHAAQEHAAQPLFRCYICSDQYNRLLTLYAHMIVHHLLDWDPYEAYAAARPPSPPSNCIFCNTTLASNTDLTNHYVQSRCKQYLQPGVLVSEISLINPTPKSQNPPMEETSQQTDKTSPDININDDGIQPKNTVKRTLSTEKTAEFSRALSTGEGTDECRDILDGKSDEEPIKSTEYGLVTTSIDGSHQEAKETQIPTRKRMRKNVARKLPAVSLGHERSTPNKIAKITFSKTTSQNYDEPETGPMFQLEKPPKNSGLTQDCIQTSTLMSENETCDFSKTATISQCIAKRISVPTVKLKELLQPKRSPKKTSASGKPTMYSPCSDDKNVSSGSKGDDKLADFFESKNRENSIKLSQIENNDQKLTKAQTSPKETKSSTLLVKSDKTEQSVPSKVTENSVFSKIKDALLSDEVEKSMKIPITQNEITTQNDKTKAHMIALENRKRRRAETEKERLESERIACIPECKKRISVPSLKLKENSEINQHYSRKRKINPVNADTGKQSIKSESSVKTTPSKSSKSKSDTVKVPKNIKLAGGKCNSKQSINHSEGECHSNVVSPTLSVSSSINGVHDNRRKSAKESSFMIRMKTIHQLKKEKNHEQCEKINDSFSNSSKITDLSKEPQYTMTDLKHILQNELQKMQNCQESVVAKTVKKAKIDSGYNSKLGNFICGGCQTMFQTLGARDRHVATDHREMRLFQCRICETCVCSHLSLRKHAIRCHPDNVSFAIFGDETETGSEYVFQCRHCRLEFPSKTAMQKHVTSCHRGGTSPRNDDLITRLIEADPSTKCQQCPRCSEIMDNEFELVIHDIEHQQDRDCDVSNVPFACPNCCRLFFGHDAKTYLKDHYNIVHLQKPYPSCDECKSEFSSTWCFYEHRRTIKNCSKRAAGHGKITDVYERLQDSKKMAFVCSRCQYVVAGEGAQMRFDQHQIKCSLELTKLSVEKPSKPVVVCDES